METLKKLNKRTLIAFAFGCLSIGLLRALEITADRFTPIFNMTDERNASIINSNFRLLSKVLVEDKGFNVYVEPNSISTTIKLQTAQKDVNYGVFVQTSWTSNVRINNKSTDEFTVEYAAQTNSGSFDWVLVR